jgi:radical SAM protein with 4Fe4S-binding SPASM domain
MTDRYLIDGHKLYWHMDRVLQWQKERIAAPVYMEISPVGFCNNRCVFCGVDFAMDNKSRLETGIFCERLHEMGELGVRSIMFAGEGEPLLHEDLGLFVKTARESGIDVSLTTNGNSGNTAVWEEILPYLTWIRFSVDAGTPQVYSKVHGVKEGFFARTIGNINEAVRIKKQFNLPVTVGIQYLIVEENAGDIRNAAELFSDMQIDYYSFKPYSFNPKMIKRRDEAYSDRTLDEIQGIVDEFKDGSVPEIIFRRQAMKNYMANVKNYNHCHALSFGGYISSRGDFYTCKEYIEDERFNAGNIYHCGMKEVFYGERRQASLRYGMNVLRIDECRRNCRMARVNEFLEMLENKPEHVNFI